MPWKGPFQIIDVKYPIVLLKIRSESLPQWVNVNRLKKAPIRITDTEVIQSTSKNPDIPMPPEHQYNLRNRN